MPSRRSFLKVLGAASGSIASMNVSAAESEESQAAPAPGAGSLQIALMQAAAAGNDQEKNLTIAERYCRQAADQGADILLMPEMWNIGYQGFGQFDKETTTKWQKQAIATDSPWVNRFRELAAELGIAIAATYLEAWPGAPRNTVSLIDRSGDIALTYAKVHTCDFAFEAALTPGEKWSAVDLDTAKGEVRVGAMICFDREFPESMRSLMLAGAEVVLTPNACLLDELRLAQFRVRAYENATAVAIANYTPLGGNSTAYDAAGASLVEPKPGDSLPMASVDLPSLRAYRQATLWGNAWRRPHRYGDLTQPVDLEIFRRNNAYGQQFKPLDR